jgi:cob(I)alamin adenosyltransferase
VRITRVYTKAGDQGMTRLAGGQEISKDHLRLEAYGTIDELNSVIGLVRALNEEFRKRLPASEKLEKELKRVQNILFDVGSLLATASGQIFPNMPKMTEEKVTHLEQTIDACQEELEPLKEFILPGGGKVASLLHLARTVCRRAERRCVKLSKEDQVDPVLLKYLNRLSDALFVWARWISKHQKEPEFLWERTSQ